MSQGPSAPNRQPVVGAASSSEALQAAWRDYNRRVLHEEPRWSQARDFVLDDLRGALCRFIPEDASVVQIGCGRGDVIAGLPNRHRLGLDEQQEAVQMARARHPGITFEVGDLKSLGQARKFDAILCDRLCHGATDIRALLAELRDHLTDDGRIYLTTFNVLWELPARMAEALGWKLPAPTSNWLSDIDFRNLFDITDLEIVRYEDRLILPLDVPLLSSSLNRVVAKLPASRRLSLYRLYALRKRKVSAASRRASVSVVVPSRNEAGNIAGAISRTPVMGTATELIFVEGGSTDDTWERIQREIAAYKGPLKLSAYRQTGKGKGDAVRMGFAKATGDLLMILDADLTVPPEELPVFYDVLASGRADYVQGTRLVYPMERGAMQFFNKLGNIAFSQLFTHLLQQPIKDTLCGTKVLWRKDYERIVATRHVLGDFDPFGDFDLLFGAARLNLKIAEVPVRYRERTYGETNISRWKHGWLLLRMSALAARKLKYV